MARTFHLEKKTEVPLLHLSLSNQIRRTENSRNECFTDGSQITSFKIWTVQITCAMFWNIWNFIETGHKACFWRVWTGKRIWYAHCWRCWESWWYQDSVVCVSTELQQFSLEICCYMLLILHHNISIYNYSLYNLFV